MTREILIALGWVVIVSGGGALALLLFLLGKAWAARQEARPEPNQAPERIVAQGEFNNGVANVMMASFVLALGIVWFLSVQQSPERPPGTPLPLSPLATVLIIVLEGLSLTLLAKALHAWRYWTKLTGSLDTIRVGCADTVFEGCPYITPERLLSIRAKALEIADLSEHPQPGGTP